MDRDTIIMSAIGALCCGGLFLAGVMVVAGTIFKWPIGINFSTTVCGECGRKPPEVRHPADTYEVLWGGWTCERCGCKNDKWGRPRDGKAGKRGKKKRQRDDDE